MTLDLLLANPYQHNQLHSFRTIRLLELQPALSDSAPLQTTLKDADLDSFFLPRYEAISYVWGPAEFTRPITCNRKTLCITPSCERILLGLRRKRRSRLLWIDSICINQKNTNERSRQVCLMDEIYKSANRVLIWLEVSGPEISSFFKYLAYCGRHCDIYEGGGFVQKLRTIIRFLRSLEDNFWGSYPNAYEDYMSIAQQIFCSPWFRRVWTLQEVSLARAKRVVMLCDGEEISWRRILRVAAGGYPLDGLIASEMQSAIAAHSFFCLLTQWERSRVRQRISLLLFGDAFRDTTLSPIQSSFLNFSSAKNVDLRLFSKHFQNVNVVLNLTRRKKCCDARDKIFGVSGILRELGVDLSPPNYQLELETIYISAASDVIRHDGNLDILRTVSSPRRAEGLPSWVPDWRTGWGFAPCFLDLLSAPYKPSRKQFGHSITRTRTLLTKGTVLDTILECSWPLTINGHDPEELIQRELWAAIARSDPNYKVLQQWFLISQKLTSYPTGDGPRDAFERTIRQETQSQYIPIGAAERWFEILAFDAMQPNSNTFPTEPQINAAEMSKAFTQGKLQNIFTIKPQEHNKASDREAQEFQRTVFDHLCGKRFFITDAGYMGIGEFSIEVGDVVALLIGQDMPVVLRQKGDAYQFIAVAYVDGLVEGHVWPECADHNQRIEIV